MQYRDSTISDFIKSYSQVDITFESIHYKEKNLLANSSDSLILLSDSLLDKFRVDLANSIVMLTLSSSEYNKYRFNPKLLSYDLYQTTELWSTILDLNELHSSTEFDINPLKVYDSSIINYINTILSLEKPFIDINEEEIG